MEHQRHGHVRFPIAPRSSRRANPPTTGGIAAPDERAIEFHDYIEEARFSAQTKALTAGISPDERAVALGRYHMALEVRARFVDLYRTSLRVPNGADAPGDQNNV